MIRSFFLYRTPLGANLIAVIGAADQGVLPRHGTFANLILSRFGASGNPGAVLILRLISQLELTQPQRIGDD